MAKKSIETGEDLDNIPEAMRQYMAMQAMESGQSLGANFLGRGGFASYGSGSMLLGSDSGPQGKVVIHHLSCPRLRIGTWRRVGQNAMDLIIFYSPEKACMTYYINNDQAGYKIEYPFSYIKNIYLDNGELGDPSDPNGPPGGLVVELNRPPNFFMDSSGSGGFFQVGDFTEDQQASQIMVHHLGGHPKVISGQLAKLVSLESFMNRHLPYDGQPLSVSAPVSPVGHRPSSQPNFVAQPHVGMFQESQWGISNTQVMRGPGHKRQRSRSVPMAVDFSMFSTPMPSFFIQHPGESQPISHNPDIYAPIPQQPNNLAAPMGSSLRIDTSSGYGMDFRQYPMSAAATTPSDFNSPAFFSQTQDTPLPASSYNTPYSVPFLSPMVDSSNMVPTSMSPLSFSSHADPAIVGQSPPYDVMQRSSSADVYSMGHDHAALSDDGHALNEMYSKHTLSLPMHNHSPSPASFMEQSQVDLDMSQLVQFDHADHASLSPEAAATH